MTRSIPPHDGAHAHIATDAAPSASACPAHTTDPVTYSSFLNIDNLLAMQDLGKEHDRLLFVIIHQSHELWFKLLLHELDAAVEMVGRGAYRAACRPLRRINRIVRSLIAQWDVLDTMTPRGYLEFRDALETGSGFQSAQFREVEFTAGLPDHAYIASPWLSDAERVRLSRRLEATTLRESFLDAVAQSGQTVPDLLRDPVEAELGDLAEQLVDFDELFALWRSRHVLSVERQIGAKPGTGNSSGIEYLRSTTTRRLFPELWDARSVL